jgi:hypothetical protein
MSPVVLAAPFTSALAADSLTSLHNPASLHDVVQVRPVLRDRPYQESICKDVRPHIDDLPALAIRELPVAVREDGSSPEPVIWTNVNETPEPFFQRKPMLRHADQRNAGVV